MNNENYFPEFLESALNCVDESWQEILRSSLHDIHQQYPDYFTSLNKSEFFPDINKLFAAFSVPMSHVKFVLFGEGPYPRRDSATGYCFMDGMIDRLWSEQEGAGFSKSVNRATSLRNFLKMCLVAETYLDAGNTGIDAIALIANQSRSENFPLIRTMQDLQHNFLRQGFLLLNAALVYRSDVKPGFEAKPWLILHGRVLSALAAQNKRKEQAVTQLILWGKVAEQISNIVNQLQITNLPSVSSEHPYNLSFISNRQMQKLFLGLNVLQRSNEA
jgi:uracil-DNA glycosylase